MARTPKKTEVLDPTDPSVDQSKINGAMDLMREDAARTELALSEQNNRVTALAKSLNYNGSTDLGTLENSARDAIRRIGMTVFELGAYLLLLREACPYGQFSLMLERLGLESRAAQRYMAVTRRFANATSTSHLEAAGVTKMVELIALEDDQLDELTDLGQTGELKLDDVARMSVKELRAAVRKERQEGAKQKNRAERQEAVNAELHEEVRLIKRLPPDEELVRVQKEAVEIQAELQGMLQGRLRQALIALNNSEPDQSLFMGGMVGQLMSDLAMLRDEFSLADMGGKPEWQRWAENQAQGQAQAAGKGQGKAN